MLLAFVYGLSTLCYFEFAQTLIIFIYSSNLSTYDSISRFGSWLQISKLDIGFLYISNIMQPLGCNIDPRISRMQFYCQSTILNYFYLIVLVIMFLLLLKLMKLLSYALFVIQSWLKTIESKIWMRDIAWILIHLFLSLILINLATELLDIRNHFYLTLSSCSFFLGLLILTVIKNPEIMKWTFISDIDLYNPVSFTLLTILKSLIHVWMYLWEGDKFHIFFEVGELWVHILIIYVLILF